jgi:hypothetical protein
MNMKKFQKTANSAMKIGTRFTATVRLVRPEAVYTEKEGDWAGSIASTLWGTGGKRKASLAKIIPGDKIAVEVTKCHPKTRCLELVPAWNTKCKKIRTKAGVKNNPKACAKKPAYERCPKGTLFLIDLSNLLGEIKGRRGADWVEAIESSLTSAGYEARFFAEYRSLIWASHQEESSEGAVRTLALESRDSVTVIAGKAEADLAMMQVASAVPGSVCVSRDRFQDYVKEFPDIAGTNRVKSFSVTSVAGKTLLLIAGVHNPVILEDEPVPAVDAVVSHGAEKHGVGDSFGGGESGLADTREDRHIAEPADDASRRKGVFTIGKNSSRHNPETFYALADQYADGDETDRKLACKYEKLGRAMERRRRETAMRERRQYAEIRRWCGYPKTHFSRKRMNSMRLINAVDRMTEMKNGLRKRGA